MASFLYKFLACQVNNLPEIYLALKKREQWELADPINE